ncbi:DNA-directed RNA polymerase III subunit RPC9-like isoform X2 [Dinothrombium tinctorium]|uniref:DNA-directed RNA polymerase III subunit RPC9 n=1 Tax=Dinothrombium tinctorium TaxID=1965070 RepID=A0A3S3RSY7_9ACAR|nr:DNA-directed RNA polymerase III subunit RPC9-like isoform X2 [Dinothrombium tinctorium]
MEIVGNERLLSNFEVLSILREIKSKKRIKDQKNVATIAYETCKYLEETPCVRQSEQCIVNYLNAIKAKAFRLTKAEKLQILNQRPSTQLEIQLLIEECEERFSEQALNEMLAVVESTLPENGDKEQEDNDNE